MADNQPTSGGTSSGTWIAVVVVFLVFLLAVLGGGLLFGLGTAKMPAGFPARPGTVVLEVIVEKVYDRSTGAELSDPCHVAATRVRVVAERGTQKTVETLIACLRSRGIVVEVEN